MRKAINILLFTILSILISLFTDIKADNFFASTLYTISGIMFSVGASMIVTFNLSGIKNQDFLIEIRQNLRDVKKSFRHCPQFCVNRKLQDSGFILEFCFQI